MSSSRPRRSSDSATYPDSALATSDYDSSSAAPPTITPDTSPESKYLASNGERSAFSRTVVVIPAAATRYLQSHSSWIDRGIQIKCSLSTDILSVEGKLHPVMRVCARSEDYQRALHFAKALTKASQFRTVVVVNDEETKTSDREIGGGDVVRQNKIKGSPYDAVETDEGIVYVEFHEVGKGRTGKGVSGGTGTEGAGSGSWSRNGGGQGDGVDGDKDRGAEGGEGKGGSRSGGGSGSAGSGGSGSAGGGRSGSAGGGEGGSTGGGGGRGRRGESGDGDRDGDRDGDGGGGGGGDGGRAAIASDRTLTSFTRWNFDDLEPSFSVMTTIGFPQTPPPISYQHRFNGLLNLVIDCSSHWKIRQGHILVVAGGNSLHLDMESSIPLKATHSTGKTSGQAATLNFSAPPSASVQFNHSTNIGITDLVHSFSTAVVGNSHGGKGKSVVVTPNHPKGCIIGSIELKMSVVPSWFMDANPVIVPLPISLRVETFFRGVPFETSKKFVSQNILLAHQISIPDIYSFQPNWKMLDGVLKDSGPQEVKDDINASSSSSTSPPMGHRSAFSTLSKKFRHSTIGRRLKPPVPDSSPSTFNPLAPPPAPQSTTPSAGSWSLFPEVTTYRIATKMGSEPHLLTTMKNLFRKAHSDDDDMIVVEYKEGEAERAEFCVSSSDIPEGVFRH